MGLRLKAIVIALSLLMGGQDAVAMRRPVLRDRNASVVLHMKTITLDKDGKFEKSYYGCSGTYIAPNLILTAAHCFENGGFFQTYARGPNEKVGYQVHLIAWDKAKDLALLKSPIKHTYVRIGGTPSIGDYILNVGSPFEFEFITSEGVLGQTGVHYHGATYLITTAMINPGSSGGGAFDAKGRLVGVNTMLVGLFGWEGITMAVDTTTINIFLGEVLKHGK